MEDLERMKNTDIISEMIADMTEELPTLVEPLIYERDRYLSYQLRDTCRRLQKSYTQSIMDSTNDDEGTVRAYGREGRGSCTRGVPIWLACIFFFFVLIFFLLMLPTISVVPCFKNIVFCLHF